MARCTGDRIEWSWWRRTYGARLRGSRRRPIMAEKATTLHFYFDYSSPFAYLGSTQAARVAKDAGVELRYEPIFLGGLFKILGGPMVPLMEFSEPKRRHANLDMNRWAAHWGVPF